MAGWTGIGRYTRHLLSEIAKRDHRHEFVVLVSDGGGRVGGWDPPGSMATHRTGIRPYSAREQWALAGEVAALEPDLVHFPHLNVPLAYRGPFVVTVHDLTMLRFKNVGGRRVAKRIASEAKHRSLGRLLESTVRRASWVLVPSAYVAGELVEVVGADPGRLTVTYEGADHFEGGIAAGELPGGCRRPYLLYVGNFYPHKNVGVLFRAMGQIGRVRPEVRLVLVGEADHFQRRLRDEAERAGVADRVLFTGTVDDATLAALYRHAELFVFPSLSEGFGLCGLEAMAHGLAVAASRRTCLPEIYGGGADYFEPEDPADLARVVLEVLENPSHRSALVRAGSERVRSYSWQRMAELTLESYERAASAR